jgi:cytochrome c-type biogenesis protein CcmH/NrfG
MWRLFSLAVFVVLIVGVVAYFCGWLHVSASHNADDTHINVNIDNQKIKHDAQKAEQKVKEGVNKVEQDIDRHRQPADQ